MCPPALYCCVRLCLAILYIYLPALDVASSSFDFEKHKLFGVYGGVIFGGLEWLAFCKSPRRLVLATHESLPEVFKAWFSKVWGMMSGTVWTFQYFEINFSKKTEFKKGPPVVFAFRQRFIVIFQRTSYSFSD